MIAAILAVHASALRMPEHRVQVRHSGKGSSKTCRKAKNL